MHIMYQEYTKLMRLFLMEVRIWGPKKRNINLYYLKIIPFCLYISGFTKKLGKDDVKQKILWFLFV